MGTHKNLCNAQHGFRIFNMTSRPVRALVVGDVRDSVNHESFPRAEAEKVEIRREKILQ